MKFIFLAGILLCGFISATADDLPGYLQELKENYENKMKIWAVDDDDFEDDDEKEWFVLKFCSCQDDNDKSIELNYRLRITVQLTDRKTDTVAYSQIEWDEIKRIGDMVGYTGRTDWQFWIPFGEMKKPKLTAYFIEFGLKQDGYFVPVAVESDKVDSAEEILEGGGSEVKMYHTLRNSIYYGEGITYPKHPLTGEKVRL